VHCRSQRDAGDIGRHDLARAALVEQAFGAELVERRRQTNEIVVIASHDDVEVACRAR